MNPLGQGPSAFDIQNHLYSSFLEGSTADVALRVQGSWHAIYNLHRVVLIQSVCLLPNRELVMLIPMQGLLSLSLYCWIYRVVTKDPS
jgi:hypothetical protein